MKRFLERIHKSQCKNIQIFTYFVNAIQEETTYYQNENCEKVVSIGSSKWR